ncbi:MAG: hypothetical protein ACTJGD_09485, partial [Mesonia hippocampi]
MRRILLVFFILIGYSAFSQVGIGTSSPNESSQLEIVSSDRGILIPQVALTDLTDQVTIVNGNVESLLVYNVSTQNDVTPGYYYWYNGSWNRVASYTDISDINTTNVSITEDGANFILTDSDGNTVSIPLKDIQLVSTIVSNGDGTYLYTNEDGDTTLIDVPADVVNEFQTIIN